MKRKSQRVKGKTGKKRGPKEDPVLFEPAAPVGGTSIIGMFYFLVGLVPRYSVCHLLPTFFHRGFPSTRPVPPPLPAFPSSGFP